MFPGIACRIGGVVFALCLLTFAFCLRSSPPAAPPQNPSSFARVPAAVVQLVAIGPGAGEKKHECAATGFLVNDAGYILTNAHVVEDAKRCLASSPGGKIVAKFGPGADRTAEAFGCDVVAVDEDHDLAVLKTESPLPERFRGTSLRLSRAPTPIGTRVWVTGHPAFTWRSKTYLGEVISRESVKLGESGSVRTGVLDLDIPLLRGASGSPVYLRSGEVVGIVSRQRGSNPLETVAVPSSEAIRLLESLDIRNPTGRERTPK